MNVSLSIDTRFLSCPHFLHISISHPLHLYETTLTLNRQTRRVAQNGCFKANLPLDGAMEEEKKP